MPDAPSSRAAAPRSARELAQAISAVERGGAGADSLIEAALAQLATADGQASRVIGVTGPPGAGKSTLVAALAELARELYEHPVTQATRERAHEYADAAVAALRGIPDGPVKTALAAFAEHVVSRTN